MNAYFSCFCLSAAVMHSQRFQQALVHFKFTLLLHAFVCSYVHFELKCFGFISFLYSKFFVPLQFTIKKRKHENIWNEEHILKIMQNKGLKITILCQSQSIRTNLLLLYINILIFLKPIFESEIEMLGCYVSNVIILFSKSTFKNLRSLCILNWYRKIIFQH